MKEKIFGVLQRVGRSFMLPIAILPIAGLLLGIGGSLTNTNMLQVYGLMDVIGPGTIWNSIFTLMSQAGNVIFANLPLLFAMGVAIGMAKQEKAVAALSSVIAFLIMHTTISQLLQIAGKVTIEGNNVKIASDVLNGTISSTLGIYSLQMGVFGGIIVGLGVAALHNKFYKIELPQVLSFFGGTRFVPIISAIVYLVVGIVMYFLWPIVQNGIYALGDIVRSSGYFGTWVYGLIERALIPFGLHHVFYLPFWQTAVGGTATIAGEVITGAQNIFFAQLADPNTTQFSVEATRFMSGKFPLMIFALPGAALAMYHCADSKKKKVAGGLLLSAALTSMLTGITEPIEFTFLFVAPMLYVIHCIFAGLAYMLMHIFNVGVGMTFSGGLIDLSLFGILQGNDKTNWIWIIIIGIIFFIVYYFMFVFIIKKFDLKTPGRDDNEEVKLYTREDVNNKNDNGVFSPANDERSKVITAGLGGKDNISDVDCCATRLRITVKDASKVKQDLLKKSGAAGVVQKGNGVQVIYGPQVTVIKSNLDLFLESSESNNINLGQEDKVEAKQEEISSKKTIKEAVKIMAPIKGNAITLEKVNDGVFSENILGEGAAIEPEEGKVYAPFDGKVSMLFDTNHAIGFISPEGVEILVHIGIDTVQLNGKYFDIKVKENQQVKKGELVATFDKEGIISDGYRTVTPVVITNTDEFEEIKVITQGNCDNNNILLEVR
ncbi:MAG: glucose PTS transporter subunit IIA [Clostridium sp.]|nr:glucose PTS transporter subunit IIA [Clostridium sp.]